MSNQTAKRLLGEGVVIVISVFVALSGEAWWSENQERESARQHLVSLERDLQQMQASLDSAIADTRTAAASGRLLLASFRDAQPEAVADSALTLLAQLHTFRVFSPSLGAYQALIGSGKLEVVGSSELLRSLADTYGSLPSIRTREEELRGAARSLTDSQPFLEMIGFHRVLLAYAETLGVPSTEVRAWASSRELQSHIALLWGQQVVVLVAYEGLSHRLAELQQLLAIAGKS